MATKFSNAVQEIDLETQHEGKQFTKQIENKFTVTQYTPRNMSGLPGGRAGAAEIGT